MAGLLMRCPSRPKLCLRVGVELSRHDALHVVGMFVLESFGLVRCCLRMHGAQGSQLLTHAMSSCRLVRPGLFIRQQSFRYERWGMVELSFTSIPCGLISAVRSTFSKALPL